MMKIMRNLNNFLVERVRCNLASHWTTQGPIQNPVVLLPHPRPPGPPGPPVIRVSHSQPTNPSQVRFATEKISPIERPVNLPTTSTTGNLINTVPRISASVNTTPAQNSDQVASST